MGLLLGVLALSLFIAGGLAALVGSWAIRIAILIFLPSIVMALLIWYLVAHAS